MYQRLLQIKVNTWVTEPQCPQAGPHFKGAGTAKMKCGVRIASRPEGMPSTRSKSLKSCADAVRGRAQSRPVATESKGPRRPMAGDAARGHRAAAESKSAPDPVTFVAGASKHP